MKSLLAAAAILLLHPIAELEPLRPKCSSVEEALRTGGDPMACPDWWPTYLDLTIVSPGGDEARRESYYNMTEAQCLRARAEKEREYEYRASGYLAQALCRPAYPDQTGGDD